MSDFHKSIETIFNAAKALAGVEREAFLDLACKGDPAFREEVERLLAAQPAADAYFGDKAIGLTAVEETLVDSVVREGPGTIIGRYKLFQIIGEGGMGVVYMAEQTQPVVRRVALKIIKLGMDTKGVIARFEAERQALALMDHPNIAKVLDAGATETGRPYFVMELVRGVPITEYCDRNHLSARQRLELLIPVCHAIQHAHQKGIIHRDIKPSNVLVTLHDGRAQPMVIDFGIAKATNQRLTEKTLFTNFSQLIGTPAYMSPEQAEMSTLDVDTRSDLYSLGVLLYELLTGTTPFTTQELMEAGYGGMQRIIAEKEPPRPSTRLSTMQVAQRTTVAENRRMELPALTRLFRGDLDWIVMKCLEKDRARRYESASGLAADLQRHLESEPVVARPPTVAYRLRKAIRRNRVAFSAVGAVTLTLLLGLGAAIWQALRAAHAERQQAYAREAAESSARRETAARQTAEAAKTEETEQRQRAERSEQKAQQLLYAAHMNLARSAWEQNDVRRVHRILEGTSAYSDKGLEWYYWQRQIHPPVKTLVGHTENVVAVATSPDGSRILTGSRDGTAKLWDTASGELIFTFDSHVAPVFAVAISPDGRRLLTGGWDRVARLWDSETGRETLVLRGHASGIVAAAFSPDGKRIVTGADTEAGTRPESTAIVWDALTGKELYRLSGHRNAVWSVGFSPDNKWIATVAQQESLRLWDASSGTECWRLDRPLFCMAFSDDSKQIAVAGGTTTNTPCSLFDLASRRELLVVRPEMPMIWDLKFAFGGRELAICGPESAIQFLDVETGVVRRKIRANGEVKALAWSGRGPHLITGSGPRFNAISRSDWAASESVAQIWDLNEMQVPPILRSDTAIEKITVSKDRTFAVTRSASILPDQNTFAYYQTVIATMRVWNPKTEQQVARFDLPKGFIGEAAISPNNQQVAVGTFIDEIGFFDLMTGARKLSCGAPGSGIVASIDYSPNGQRIVAGTTDGVARIWDAHTGSLLAVLAGHKTPSDPFINRVGALFSHDGQNVFSWGGDGTARIWEVDAGKELRVLKGHRGPVTSGAIAPDGARFATGSADGTIRVWSAESGEFESLLEGHPLPIEAISFDAAGRRVISKDQAGTCKVWDPETGNELLNVNRPKGFRLTGISADGHRLLAFGDESSRDYFHKQEISTPEQVALSKEEERRIAARVAAIVAPQPPEVRIPQRMAGLPASLLDLSAHYNSSAKADIHDVTNAGNNLARLPLGMSTFGGIQFDARGVIQLSSTNLRPARPDYPEAVPGIRVAAPLIRLHLLHGTGWSGEEPNKGAFGTEIARHVIHYRNGHTAMIPIRYGNDVRDWNFFPEREAEEQGGAQPAWKGPQDRYRAFWPDRGVRLYITTWTNPQPEALIDSIDLISTMTGCAPFIVGISLEPLHSDAQPVSQVGESLPRD